jgi:hypothetical protein
MTNAFNLSQLANNTNSSGQVALGTGVSGTLGVANGGTGAATLTSANVILGAGTSAVTFVAPGTTGNILKSNGTTWTSGGMPAGSVLQVVQTAYSTLGSTSSASYVTSNLTASITPRSTSSKILITSSIPIETGTANRQMALTIYRGATNLSSSGTPLNGFGKVYTNAGNLQLIASMSYLDSPATTSSTAYTIYYASVNVAGAVTVFSDSQTGTITLMEIQG